MVKSELVTKLANQYPNILRRDIEKIVNIIFDEISEALRRGENIEIRGFGSFSLHYRVPRIGRNPKTGTPVALSGKHVPHFKPGKELRDRVNNGIVSQQNF